MKTSLKAAMADGPVEDREDRGHVEDREDCKDREDRDPEASKFNTIMRWNATPGKQSVQRQYRMGTAEQLERMSRLDSNRADDVFQINQEDDPTVWSKKKVATALAHIIEDELRRDPEIHARFPDNYLRLLAVKKTVLVKACRGYVPR